MALDVRNFWMVFYIAYLIDKYDRDSETALEMAINEHHDSPVDY